MESKIQTVELIMMSMKLDHMQVVGNKVEGVFAYFELNIEAVDSTA